MYVRVSTYTIVHTVFGYHNGTIDIIDYHIDLYCVRYEDVQTHFQQHNNYCLCTLRYEISSVGD